MRITHFVNLEEVLALNSKKNQATFAIEKILRLKIDINLIRRN